jgi:hypothetical protein
MAWSLVVKSVLGTLALLGGMAAIAPCEATVAAGQNVTTYHYDNLRTGWNPNETVLTQATVQHGSGGQTFKMTSFTSLDDQVDTQPLIVTNQTITGQSGPHDVVYVTTENNTVYAIDANSGAILLQRNFGPPVTISQLPGGCNNNANDVGIGGTPVIDAANNLMYFIAYTNTENQPKYLLHEVNLSTLADVVPKIRVAASGKLANGHTYHFNENVSRQRAALLFSSGNIYAGFASFCDVAADQSRGWVLGWQAGTLTPLASNELANKLSSSPDDFFLSSIWMSGFGLAASPTGDVYFVTGNSDPTGTTIDGVQNIAESVVQLSSDLSTVKSVFTPDGAGDLDEGDTDFGSGGVTLLPTQTGAASNLAVAAGKDGNMYFLNADNLNDNTTGSKRILGTYGIGGCWCGQSYYTNVNGVGVVVSSGGNSVDFWKIRPGTRSTLAESHSSAGIPGAQDPGFFTAVSSNGTAPRTSVVWAVSRPDGSEAENISLYAFSGNDASTLFSAVAGTWPNTGGNANIAPVAANGKVYVASYQGLAIFGLSSAPAATLPATAPPPVARIALAPGVHEIYGTVRAINGWTVTVATRNGRLVTVNTLTAAQNGNMAQPSVGHGILVRGTYTSANAMTAVVILHAKDHAAMWLSDR